MIIQGNREIGKALSLIERMEGSMTPMQAILNEERLINEAKITRRVTSPDDLFDYLDTVTKGSFVSIGYVSGANLALPQVKRRNPASNKMKNYNDYSVFEGGDEIGALVKITSYNLRYHNRADVMKKYGEFKSSSNDIRADYGLPPIADKKGYTSTMDYGKGGVSVYNGNNKSLAGHSYCPQNVAGIEPDSVVYVVNTEGNIVRELSRDEVKPYLAEKKPLDGVNALRKLGAEDAKVKEYIRRITDLKFKYHNFENNSILWVVATTGDGEKFIYLNSNLNRCVDGININPEDFLKIAKERYKNQMAEMPE